MTAAVELTPGPDQPGSRGYTAVEQAFFEPRTVLRQAGDPIVLTPALVAGDEDIAALAQGVRQAVGVIG